VMHQGEICESGDHRSLLEQRGFYWRLHELQAHRESTGQIVDIARAGGFRRQEI